MDLAACTAQSEGRWIGLGDGDEGRSSSLMLADSKSIPGLGPWAGNGPGGHGGKGRKLQDHSRLCLEIKKQYHRAASCNMHGPT
jgi:hypothetical protein